MDDWEDAETIEECTEMATVDCNGEDEEAYGWLNALNDVFSDVKQVKVAGEVVKFKNFDMVNDTAVVAICEKNKKKIKVTLDSLELINPTKAQELWLEAWLDWAK
jgi:hypothetical protein